MKPNFRHIRQMIYGLKRQYGQAIQLCRTIGDVTDFSTGVQSVAQLVKVNVARAIVAPAKVSTTWKHATPDVAAQSRPFNFGGIFEHSIRLVLVSRRDLPGDWPIDTNTFIIFGGKRYEVKEVHDYEEQECLGFFIDALTGADIQAEVPTTTVVTGPSLPAQPAPLLTSAIATRQFVVTGTAPLAQDPMDVASGVFDTAGAQTVTASSLLIALPADAASFVADPNITVYLAGQKLIKGLDPSTRGAQVVWVSPTKLMFLFPLQANDVIEIFAPTIYYPLVPGPGANAWLQLVITGTVPLSGDPLNVQTGAFATAGAQTIVAQTGTALLPVDAVRFDTDPGINVWVNGQRLTPAIQVVWLSTTTFSFTFDLNPNDVVEVETPTAY